MAFPAGLGGEQPQHTGIAELAPGVDKRVDQIAVAVAIPKQDDVHDVVRVCGHEIVTAPGDDFSQHGLVDVVVLAELLDQRSGLDPKPVGQVPLALRAGRGRAHDCRPPVLTPVLSHRAAPAARWTCAEGWV